MGMISPLFPAFIHGTVLNSLNTGTFHLLLTKEEHESEGIWKQIVHVSERSRIKEK
jgi:hypothetical protein